MTLSSEPTSRFYDSQGLKLHYLDWGNTAAPTLIFVHGMHDHAHSWDWVARVLSHDWHVVALDLRGHGDSAWSPDGAYQNAYFLCDFAELVEALGVAKISIVAHSLGGNPSVRYAALYPDRVEKLVLVDAMGPSASVIEGWEKQGVVNRSRDWLEKRRATQAKTPRRFSKLEDAVARMANANKHLTAEQVHHLATHGLRQFDDGYSWKFDPMVGNFQVEDFAIDLAEYWREITAPTLICWGPESWTSNPALDGRASHFRDHKNIAFDKAGHWLHHDQLEEFISALEDFLGANSFQS